MTMHACQISTIDAAPLSLESPHRSCVGRRRKALRLFVKIKILIINDALEINNLFLQYQFPVLIKLPLIDLQT